MHEEGDTVAKDLDKASSLYQRACDASHGGSCSRLGSLNELGLGRKKDLKAAFSLYEKGCNLKSYQGCSSLGELFEKGQGAPKIDNQRAAELYRNACGGRHPAGCHLLGSMIEKGKLGPVDPVEALAHHGDACRYGDPRGCVAAFKLLDRGHGAKLPRDKQQALEYKRRACNLGQKDLCKGLPILLDVIDIDSR
jgi:hypothetical protein